MVLVDTSVWIEHLRARAPGLAHLLTEGQVLSHLLVVGELACGNLSDRRRILADLSTLPSVKHASHQEVLDLVENRRLWGQGIGWIDSHLLASTLITGCEFWTFDKVLHRVARGIGLSLYH